MGLRDGMETKGPGSGSLFFVPMPQFYATVRARFANASHHVLAPADPGNGAAAPDSGSPLAALGARLGAWRHARRRHRRRPLRLRELGLRALCGPLDSDSCRRSCPCPSSPPFDRRSKPPGSSYPFRRAASACVREDLPIDGLRSAVMNRDASLSAVLARSATCPSGLRSLRSRASLTPRPPHDRAQSSTSLRRPCSIARGRAASDLSATSREGISSAAALARLTRPPGLAFGPLARASSLPFARPSVSRRSLIRPPRRRS